MNPSVVKNLEAENSTPSHTHILSFHNKKNSSMKATQLTKLSKSSNKSIRNKCKESLTKPSSQGAWQSATGPNPSWLCTNSKSSMNPGSKSLEPKDNFKSMKISWTSWGQESKMMRLLKIKRIWTLTKGSSKKLSKSKILANKPKQVQNNQLSKELIW